MLDLTKYTAQSYVLNMEDMLSHQHLQSQLDQLEQSAAAGLTLQDSIFFKRVAAILFNVGKVFNTTLSNCHVDIHSNSAY